MPNKPRLLDRVREQTWVRHYSIRTEQAYTGWIRRFILFHRKRHPADMGAPEVERFLTHLAVVREVSASTQNQALNAILFLYREVLHIELPWLDNVTRAQRPKRLPVVLGAGEVRCILAHLDGKNWLMASLLYGAGLRLMECLRLRIKDIDFDYRQITVQDGKQRQLGLGLAILRTFLFVCLQDLIPFRSFWPSAPPRSLFKMGKRQERCGCHTQAPASLRPYQPQPKRNR
jgi:integrase